MISQVKNNNNYPNK